MNKKTLLLTFAAILCFAGHGSAFGLGAPGVRAALARTGPATDVSAIAAGYPPCMEANQAAGFNAQFLQYMKWLGELNVPDALLVLDQMENGGRSLDVLATVLHEKVELAGWLKLGHNFEDIMTIPYYQKHYDEVYPVAHRDAMIAQYGLIKYFAATANYPDIPELAYVLVSPLIEQRENNNAERMARTARYNPEFSRVAVTRADIRTAMQVFEAGGYKYKNPGKVASEAEEYIKIKLRIAGAINPSGQNRTTGLPRRSHFRSVNYLSAFLTPTI